MGWQDTKIVLGKVWNFLWHEESVISWIVSLLLAFIIIKFIFFPLLSLAFGAAMPLVVVESSSMHHPGFLSNTIGTSSSFNSWWDQYSSWYISNNITKDKAEHFSLRNGLEMGDIVVVYGRTNYKVGDIIVFNAGQNHPIIHRIVKITQVDNELVYSTKGDNNNNPGQEQIPFEKSIKHYQILGKAGFRIPKLGWLKLGFVKLFNLSS